MNVSYQDTYFMVSPTPKLEEQFRREAFCVNVSYQDTYFMVSPTPKLEEHPLSAVRDCLFNPLNPELNPICYFLALLAHHFLHVSMIRVKSLTLRLLMSYIYMYIYMEQLFLMFLDHTQRRSTVGRTPLDE